MYNVMITDIRGITTRYQSCISRPYMDDKYVVILKDDTDIIYMTRNIVSVKVVDLSKEDDIYRNAKEAVKRYSTIEDLRANHQISIDDIMKGE